jgi:hypothetical protein
MEKQDRRVDVVTSKRKLSSALEKKSFLVAVAVALHPPKGQSPKAALSLTESLSLSSRPWPNGMEWTTAQV